MRRLYSQRSRSKHRRSAAMKWSLLCTLAFSCPALADPVWHCSRNAPIAERTSSAHQAQENEFSISSFNSSADVIGISISDLIDIYSGVPVRIGGLPLSACFMPSDQGLTSVALTSLGLHASTIQALARKSSIVQNNLHSVTTPKQMVTCIAQHFPAVGYLDEPTETAEVQPCF